MRLSICLFVCWSRLQWRPRMVYWASAGSEYLLWRILKQYNVNSTMARASDVGHEPRFTVNNYLFKYEMLIN